MSKKLLALFLSFSVLFGVLNLPVNAEGEESELLAYEKFGIDIGCFESEEYSPDKSVSRGEFAKVIANICNLVTIDDSSQWEENVYGEKDNSETIIISDDDNIFDDVDSSHPYYNEIAAVYNKGYMVGIADRRFAPDYDISVMEVSKVLIDMLGYANIAAHQGGYPAGYKDIINQIDLLNGVGADYNEVITQRDIVKILYNIMDEAIVEAYINNGSGYRVSEDGDTFMNTVLGIYKVSDVLVDNGITTISGQTKIKKDEIKVGEVVAKLPAQMESYRKLIGHRVQMYYTHDEYLDENTIKFIHVQTDDDTITVSADDFSSFDMSTGIFTYAKDGKIVSKRISTSANMIYNNKIKTTPYSENDFIFETGDITLCKIADKDYDLIIINDYKTVYVSSVSIDDKTISNGIVSKTPGSDNLLTLTENVYGDFIIIRDENSNVLSMNDITVGSVLSVLECSGGIEIIVSKKVVSDFKLAKYSLADTREREEWTRKEIFDDTESYEILKSYYDMTMSETLNVRDNYRLYLDMNGNVAWIEKTSNEGKNIGIVTRAIYDSDEEKAYVKIYTTSAEIKTFEVAERYSLNGDDRRKAKDTIETEINPYKGKAVLYTVNDEGKLSGVITPAEFADKKNETRGWHYLNEADKSYHFGTNGKDFNKQFYYVSGKTKVFTIPETNANNEYSDVKNFSINIASFEDGNNITVDAYAFSPDAVEADVIVWEKAVTGGSTVNYRSAFLVQDISSGINEDDEAVYYIDGYELALNQSAPSFKTLIVSQDASMIKFSGSSGVGTVINPESSESEAEIGPKSPQDIEPGDIIRYNTNIKGEVDYIAIAYDCVPGYKADGTPMKGKSYHNGAIYGDGVNRDYYAEGAVYSGDLMSKHETGIKINVSNTLMPSQITAVSDIVANVRAFRTSGIPVLIVRKGGRGNVEITQGSVGDGFAYNDTNSRYDRVVLVGHMTSLLYGAVIYK